MMKVYQPVCPDIKFRLVADLSPDLVEESEDSTTSSDSSSCSLDEDDVQLLYEDTPINNSHTPQHPCNRFTPNSAAATPFPIRTTAQICHQHPAHSSVTSPVSLAAELSSASACQQTSSRLKNGVHEDTDCMDNHLDLVSNHVTNNVDSTPPQQTMVCCTENTLHEDDASATAHNTNFSAPETPDNCSLQRPVCCYNKIHSNVNHHVQAESSVDDSNDSIGHDSDDDDSDSIEDISISHNVPMCPPSPAPMSPVRSPARGCRVVVTVAEEKGSVVASSPRCEMSERVRSSGLQLDVHAQSSRYQGPYTLACAITPSPLHEHITMASTLSSSTNNNDNSRDHSHTSSVLQSHTNTNDDSCDNNHTSSTVRSDITTTASSNYHHHLSQPGSPRNQPEVTDKYQGQSSSSSNQMVRSIFDEIQEALIKEVGKDVLDDPPPLTSDTDVAQQQYPFIHKHVGYLFDKKRLLIGYATSGASRRTDTSTPSSCRSRNLSGRSRHSSGTSVASEAATSLVEDVCLDKMEERPSSDGEEGAGVASMAEDLDGAASAPVMYGQERRRKNSDGDGSRRHSTSTMSTPYCDLEVTHRGMHRFIPRHTDEIQVGIGDPIHVVKEFDDLWCEGVNLRTGERGIFPAMYANDLTFLEESDEEDEHWKFTMRFLGTVEVTSASGDFALCQAINKVAQQGRIKTASLCTLEINQYGIRMLDKSKEGHESHKFTNFFALKNISFCGTHPNNNRYFAFITKHPREVRFACHVFHSERSTHRARDALGKAFKRFYQEYMAFTHPTEDIWIE